MVTLKYTILPTAQEIDVIDKFNEIDIVAVVVNTEKQIRIRCNNDTLRNALVKRFRGKQFVKASEEVDDTILDTIEEVDRYSDAALKSNAGLVRVGEFDLFGFYEEENQG